MAQAFQWLKTPRLYKLVVSGEIKKMQGVFITKKIFLELTFVVRLELEKLLPGQCHKKYLLPSMSWKLWTNWNSKASLNPLITWISPQLFFPFPNYFSHMYPFWFCKLEYRIPLYSYISHPVWYLLITLDTWRKPAVGNKWSKYTV